MTTLCAQVEHWSSFRVWLYSLYNTSPKSNAAIIEHISLTSADRVLDVGCGLGAAMERAAATGAQVAGVDPSPAMVERASRRVPETDVKIGSAETIPFPDDTFTVVVNVASYHHWADTKAGLTEILRVLADGGRLYVMEAERKGKHGLNPESAAVLAQTLLDLGYSSSAVDSLKVGRSEYLVVSAVTPT